MRICGGQALSLIFLTSLLGLSSIFDWTGRAQLKVAFIDVARRLFSLSLDPPAYIFLLIGFWFLML